MSAVIFKHAMHLEDVDVEFDVSMPRGSEIVSFAEQYPGELAFWFRCDPEALPVERKFKIVGTGHRFHPSLQHRGTALCANGALILHLMEAA